MKRDYGIYHIGLKALLKKEDTFLVLNSSYDNYIDLPGGRIDNVEYNTPFEEILDREIKEELGDIKYKLGRQIFYYRRHYRNPDINIFLVVYATDFLSGEIKLSKEHNKYRWLNPVEFVSEENNFFTQEEYLTFKKYFESLKN